MKFRTRIEINLTGDTCKAPEVLILEIRTIAPAHHLHSYQVLARLQILGDIKLGSHLAVFTISHILAVHPKGQVAGSRTYMEIDILALPVLRKFESTTIRTRIVVEFADVWRIRIKLGFPGITYILVGGISITVQFEQPRYREILPLRIVIVGCKEVGRTLVVILHEVKLPHAFHRKIVGRLLLVKALCFVKGLVCKESSTTRFAVLLVDIHIMPTRLLLSRHAIADRQQGEAKRYICYISEAHIYFFLFSEKHRVIYWCKLLFAVLAHFNTETAPP